MSIKENDDLKMIKTTRGTLLYQPSIESIKKFTKEIETKQTTVSSIQLLEEIKIEKKDIVLVNNRWELESVY